MLFFFSFLFFTMLQPEQKMNPCGNVCMILSVTKKFLKFS